MKAQEFRLGDVLSMTTGRLLSRDHMDGIYKITSHMVGHSVWTHELPSHSEKCAAALLLQFPQLEEVDPDKKPEGLDWMDWLTQLEAKYGDSFMVAPLLNAGERTESPIATLTQAMRRAGRTDDPIVVVAGNPDNEN